MTWKNNSQKHSLAAKGIKTSYDSSGIWFESRGILRDTPLSDAIDVEAMMTHHKTFRINPEEIKTDLKHIYILPIKKVDESIAYLKEELAKANKKRVKHLLGLIKIAKSTVAKKLGTTKNMRIKEELHYSYSNYDELTKNTEAKQ